MIKWTSARLDRIAKENLNKEDLELWEDPPRSTIEEWEKSCYYQAQLFEIMTGCVCWELSLHKQFLELLQLHRETAGKPMTREEINANTQEAIELRKRREGITRRYGRQHLCHYRVGAFICYCDEHSHARNIRIYDKEKY